MKVKDHEFCLRCGRRLKKPEARELGYGSVCYRKMLAGKGHRLFDIRCEELRQDFTAVK